MTKIISLIFFSASLLFLQAQRGGSFQYDFSNPQQPWKGLDKPANTPFLKHPDVSKPVTVIQGDGTPYQKNKRYASIRIPAAEVANDGSLICLIQARLKPGDRDPDHAIIMRSTDFGKSWSQNIIFKENNNTDFGDNSLVIDRTNGRLFAFIYTSAATMLYTSDDHGITWEREPNISREDGKIRMRGTTGIQIPQHPKQPMIMPGIIGKGDLGYLYCEAGKKQWSVLAIDKDSGQYNEPTTFEVDDNNPQKITLFNLSRVSSKGLKRKYKFNSHFQIDNSNLQQKGNWKNGPTVQLKKLICNQHLKRYSGLNDGKKSVVLYSSPTLQTRFGGTVGFSLDEGKTWKTKKIVPDNIHFAYSSQVVLPDGSIGLFYETHNNSGKKVRHGAIKFIRYSAKWLRQ